MYQDIIHPDELPGCVLAYTKELIDFASESKIKPLLKFPVDHVAFKLQTLEAYNRELKFLKPRAVWISQRELDNRLIATVILKKPLQLPNIGSCSIVEVMQVKPGIMVTVGSIDHIELFAPNFNHITTALNERGVPWKERVNINHCTVELEINEWGQGLKFTDIGLRTIAKREVSQGVGELVYQDTSYIC